MRRLDLLWSNNSLDDIRSCGNLPFVILDKEGKPGAVRENFPPFNKGAQKHLFKHMKTNILEMEKELGVFKTMRFS